MSPPPMSRAKVFRSRNRSAGMMAGRGLHSCTLQFNLSRFCHTSPCPPVY